MKKLEPQEIFWNQLYRVVRRRPAHPPREMRSAQSQPPIRAWVCDDCAAFTGLTFTYTSSAATPICYGSARTSFFPEEPRP